VQWLWLIKLFELEVSVRKMAQQVGLSYRAVYAAVKAIRFAILAHAEDAKRLVNGEIERDESYFGGRRKR
jgi:transposase